MIFTLTKSLKISVILLYIIKSILGIIVTDGIDTQKHVLINTDSYKDNNNDDNDNLNTYNDNDTNNFNKTCYLPNQNDKGICVLISECQAYLKVKNFTDLTPRNINFLKQVQCRSQINYKNFNNDIKQSTVCCPTNGIDYKLPQIEFSTLTTISPITNSSRARILVGDLKYNKKNKKFKKRNYKNPNNNNNNNITTSISIIDNECGEQMTNRIFSGEIAELDEYPWLALIFYNSTAHCVTGPIVREKKGLKYVRLGEFNVKTEPDCVEEINYVNCADASVDIGIERVHVHPDYNERTLNKLNDIALIKLKKYVTFTHFIMPICLPKKDDKESPLLRPGTYFSVSGWGKTDLFNKFFLNIQSPIKLKLRVPLVSRKNCSQILNPYGVILGPNQICAGGEYARDTCAGDSGGPLMHFDTKHFRWITYGIVSYGFTQCGLAGHPAVYTNVVEYIDWIRDILLEKN